MPPPRSILSGSAPLAFPGCRSRGRSPGGARALPGPAQPSPARPPLVEQRAPQPRTSPAAAGLPQRVAGAEQRAGRTRPLPQPSCKKRAVGECGQHPRLCCGRLRDALEQREIWRDSSPEAPATFRPALQLQERPGEIQPLEKCAAFLCFAAFCV